MTGRHVDIFWAENQKQSESWGFKWFKQIKETEEGGEKNE